MGAAIGTGIQAAMTAITTGWTVTTVDRLCIMSAQDTIVTAISTAAIHSQIIGPTTIAITAATIIATTATITIRTERRITTAIERIEIPTRMIREATDGTAAAIMAATRATNFEVLGSKGGQRGCSALNALFLYKI